MSRETARFVHLSVLVAAATGLVYGWTCYFGEPADEFSVAHPWRPAAHLTHVLGTPLLVFACGLIWRSHVWARIRSGFHARRGTGLWLAAWFAPMCLTGYSVQVAVDETWRDVWAWSHGISSIAWALGYVVHQLRSRPADRKREVADDS